MVFGREGAELMNSGHVCSFSGSSMAAQLETVQSLGVLPFEAKRLHPRGSCYPASVGSNFLKCVPETTPRPERDPLHFPCHFPETLIEHLLQIPYYPKNIPLTHWTFSHIVLSLFCKWGMKHRAVKQLARGHTAGRWLMQCSNRVECLVCLQSPALSLIRVSSPGRSIQNSGGPFYRNGKNIPFFSNFNWMVALPSIVNVGNNPEQCSQDL